MPSVPASDDTVSEMSLLPGSLKGRAGPGLFDAVYSVSKTLTKCLWTMLSHEGLSSWPLDMWPISHLSNASPGRSFPAYFTSERAHLETLHYLRVVCWVASLAPQGQEAYFVPTTLTNKTEQKKSEAGKMASYTLLRFTAILFPFIPNPPKRIRWG